MTYEQWKAELIKVTAEKTNQPEYAIKISDDGAREWFDSGATPYQTFRETYQIENDGQ